MKTKLTNALNAIRGAPNNSAAAAAPTLAAAAAAPKPRARKAVTAAAATLANAFPRNSNSVAPLTAAATTNERDRMLASLTTMRDSAKEMIDTMYSTATKLARSTAKTNNGGLLRSINAGIPATVTRKARSNKGVPRGPRTVRTGALPLSPISEETNSALRGEGATAHVNNLSALEPSPIEAAQHNTR